MDCIIIEDQLPAQRVLQKYIDDVSNLNLKGTYSNALQAIDILQEETIDLIFLDIHLPKLSGFDFIRSINNPPAIIITTAFTNYALEGYELNIVDYLLKPFSFQRFIQAISKVSIKQTGLMNINKNLVNEPKKEIFVKTGYEHVKIDVGHIFYIHSDADYTEIHLQHKKYLTSESLKHWEEELKDDNFIRVHKSFVVNLSHIQKISRNRIIFDENKNIPIGRVYKKAFTQRYKSYSI